MKRRKVSSRCAYPFLGLAITLRSFLGNSDRLGSQGRGMIHEYLVCRTYVVCWGDYARPSCLSFSTKSGGLPLVPVNIP